MLKSIAFIVFVAFFLSLSFVSAQNLPETIHSRFGGIVSSDLTEFTFRFSVMVDKTPEIMSTATFQNREVVARATKSNIINTIKTEYYLIRNETYMVHDIVDYEKRETIREYRIIDSRNNTRESVPSNCVIISNEQLSCYTEIPIYKDVEKTRTVYELFDMNKGLEPDIWYDFEVRVHKQASIGDFAIDIVPTIAGYDLPYAWWNSSFTDCRNITFNRDMIASDINNFQSLIYLNNAGGGFSAAESDYSDIRFIDGACNMGGGELFYELENYTAQNATFFVLVNLTKSANKIISVYYGSENASSKSNPDAVWGGYSLVIHGNQTSTGAFFDSSPNHNRAETKNMESGDMGRVGMIDGAFNMDGTDEFINVSDSTNLNFGDNTSFSYSIWAYPRGNAGNTLIIKQKDAAPNEGYYMRFDATTNYARCGVDSTPFIDIVDSINHMNSWTYIVCDVNRSNNNFSLYVNGVYIASDSLATIATVNNTNSLHIGIGRDAVTYPMIGFIDETRIFRGSHSLTFINATYQNVKYPYLFSILGPPETEPIPVPPTPPINISYVWDLGQELPVMTQYCAADGYSLVTVRGRYAYSATGDLYFVNQTDTQTCQYGCADSTLISLGYAGCRESTLTYALIFIFVVIGVVLFVRLVVTGGGT
jgi:hypothetical protein